MGLTFWEPTNVAEAVAKLSELGDRARLLAGGTDLLVQFERRQVHLEHVISLEKIPELRGITTQGTGSDAEIVIGAATSHRMLERCPLLQGAHRSLALACETVGGIQTRNMGTLGGNLCNASPAADTVPALLAVDARVTLSGPDGDRTLPLEQFLLGPRKTALRPGELLVRIHLPKLESNSATHFLKMGRRSVMEIAAVNVAARVTLAADGQTLEVVRVALGAVAPTAIRAHAAEELLTGKRLAEVESLLPQVGQLAMAAAQPISDVRASAEYRRHVVGVLTRRALQACLQQVRGAERSAS